MGDKRATLTLGGRSCVLDRPYVMGVVNVTPDSFSGDGQLPGFEQSLKEALTMIDDGADMIDVGGESSRPGASPVSDDEELRRVLPLVEALAARGVVVSVDTVKPTVMQAAIDAGAAMINDIQALQAPEALAVVARSQAAVCLMHMQGAPRTMQDAPVYGDVLAEVKAFLLARANALETAGVARERIALDPGFGFGKTVAHNLALMHGLPELAALGYPLLAGWSRKSTLGHLTGRAVDERLAASIAASLAAVARGANIVRVHDVRETVDALRVWCALT
ncbi:MAG: dihydropteroate synthase [Proteobacteria bacterium]|nr:dihydropteroate synthase [Pseudomonadota bacterium]MCL2308222.1 dihydropteroate synthase [Pseudomonadota bacterium]